jgi:hypothetical protein
MADYHVGTVQLKPAMRFQEMGIMPVKLTRGNNRVIADKNPIIHHYGSIQSEPNTSY